MSQLGTVTTKTRTFDKLFRVILDDSSFRAEFFANPAKAVQSIWPDFPTNDVRIIVAQHLNNQFRIEPVFNEKLVLCSSSGY